MIVVADSGPLHYLILLDHSELLRRFYSRVVVPDAVVSALSAAGAPDSARLDPATAIVGRCGPRCP